MERFGVRWEALRWGGWVFGLCGVLWSPVLCGASEPSRLKVAMEKLRSSDARGQYEAAGSLAQMGAQAEPAVLLLAKRLESPVWWVRLRVVNALRQLGPSAHRAVPSLIQALKDKEEDVRRVAVEALGEIGPLAVSASSILRKLFRKSSWKLQASILTSLGKIGSPKALPECLFGLRSSTWLVRVRALRALRRLKVTSAAVIQAVKKATLDGEVAVKFEANYVLEVLQRLAKKGGGASSRPALR